MRLGKPTLREDPSRMAAMREHLGPHEVPGFGLDQYMTEGVVIDKGYAIAPMHPGHGIEFDFDALAAHKQ